MKCEEFESLAESYIDETLSDKARDRFEEHYFVCDSCYASLKIIENLKNKNIHIVTGNKKLFAFSMNPSAVFATLSIFIFSFLFYLNTSNRFKKLVEISGFSPPVYVVSENRGEEATSNFAKAMKYYNEGNYGRAYEVISTVNQGNPRTWFFGGILGLLNGDNNKALGYFNMIIEEMNPSYYDEAVFYKGISLLRMNKKEEALNEFENLEKMFTPFRSRAVELIKKIKKLK